MYRMYRHDTGSWHYTSRVQLSFHGLQETVWQKVHAANVHAFEPRQLSRQTRPSLQVCIVNKSKVVSLVALSAIMLCDAMWCCVGRGSPHSPLLLEVSRTKLQWKPMSGHLNYVTPLIPCWCFLGDKIQSAKIATAPSARCQTLRPQLHLAEASRHKILQSQSELPGKT